MTITIPEHYQDYLVTRYRTYDERAVRYRATARVMQHMNLSAQDSVLDIGGGDAEMEKCLREEFGFQGAYYNYDFTTGHDIYDFLGEAYMFDPDFIVCLETIEHLNPFYAHRLLGEMPLLAHKGVVLTTPNGDAQNVFEMDDTHLWAATEASLEAAGYATVTATLYDGFYSDGKPDGLVAWASRVW
jgi:hypothetical protein